MRSGLTPIIATDNLDRVERQFVFRRVGTLPLVVSIGIARNEARAEAWSQLWPLPLGLTAFITTLALFATAFARERRRREAAEHEGGEKSRFLTTLSHELRTPLHGVLGYADQLSRDPSLNVDQSRQVSEIARAGRHMRDVVNVVLDYARIEALGPALHMRRINVQSLVEDCLAIVRPAAVARGLQARITVADGTPDHFVADDVQLRQVLTNLLSNAVKYTPQGTIELHLAGDAERLVIEVSDTGIGIPEGQRHNLFKEYERFGTERTSIQGTGLGLAIAHRLMRRMGGYIGHRNNPGGGSIFWLELPAGTADESEAQAVAETVPAEHLAVLVVDDSEINRAVAASYLRQAGHAAIEAADGCEAVRLAATQDFDVVLMDMRMVDMDGLEATARVRALDGARGQVPIVAVTANALDRHAEECRRAGMSEYLAKPFTHEELLAVVARAAAKRSGSKIDDESIAQLTSSMGEEAVQRLFDCLALRTEAMLRKLENPAAFASTEELADLAHELVGSAGMLGLIQLASAASRFETALLSGTAEPTEMRRELANALAGLRRRRSLEAMLSR